MGKNVATAACRESAAHWRNLADDSDRMGDYYAGRGEYDGVEREKAESYRRTAEAIEIGERTGVAVCSCCFKPFGGGVRVPMGRVRS